MMLLIILAGCLSLALSWHEARAEDSQSKMTLDTTINPNHAPLGSLIRLPGIGVSRARAIIAYRESIWRVNQRALPFSSPDDLARVKGLGPALIRDMMPFLEFTSGE